MNFWRSAFIIFALLAAANYFPLLLGFVPFPAHLAITIISIISVIGLAYFG